MNYKISDDRKTLTIFVDEAERQELRKIETCGGDCQCDVSMHDFLEPLICNSELEWIPEGVTGDLTSAPMLGIYGDEEKLGKVLTTPRHGEIESYRDGQKNIYARPILERWAFMDYQVRSVLEDLRDRGECVFIS